MIRWSNISQNQYLALISLIEGQTSRLPRRFECLKSRSRPSILTYFWSFFSRIRLTFSSTPTLVLGTTKEFFDCYSSSSFASSSAFSSFTFSAS